MRSISDRILDASQDGGENIIAIICDCLPRLDLDENVADVFALSLSKLIRSSAGEASFGRMFLTVCKQIQDSIDSGLLSYEALPRIFDRRSDVLDDVCRWGRDSPSALQAIAEALAFFIKQASSREEATRQHGGFDFPGECEARRGAMTQLLAGQIVNEHPYTILGKLVHVEHAPYPIAASVRNLIIEAVREEVITPDAGVVALRGSRRLTSIHQGLRVRDPVVAQQWQAEYETLLDKNGERLFTKEQVVSIRGGQL